MYINGMVKAVIFAELILRTDGRVDRPLQHIILLSTTLRSFHYKKFMLQSPSLLFSEPVLLGLFLQYMMNRNYIIVFFPINKLFVRRHIYSFVCIVLK